MGSRDYHQALANQIIEYWARRGHSVNVSLVQLTATVQGEGENVDTYKGYGIRSDMVNGWPRSLYEKRVRGL